VLTQKVFLYRYRVMKKGKKWKIRKMRKKEDEVRIRKDKRGKTLKREVWISQMRNNEESRGRKLRKCKEKLILSCFFFIFFS